MLHFGIPLAGKQMLLPPLHKKSSARPYPELPVAAVPGGRLPSSQRSRRFALPLGLDDAQHLVHLCTPVLIGRARMTEIGFKFVRALDRWIDQS